MLRLYVLRHAKSSWAEPGRPDFERGLNARGQADLVNIAAMLRDRRYFAETVLCSPAVRTRSTLQGILGAFEREPVIDYIDALYSDGIPAYFDAIRAVQSSGPIMIVGHNPMCEGLSATLVGSGEPAALYELALKFPTGSLAVFDIDRPSWADIDEKSGHLADFVIPREL